MVGAQLILWRFYLECSGYTHKKCSLCVHKNTSQETTATVGHTTLSWCVYLFENCMFMCCFLKPPSLPAPQTTQYFFYRVCSWFANTVELADTLKALALNASLKRQLYLQFLCSSEYFFSHICIPSVFFFVSVLFQEQATKVVRSNQGHGFLSPVPLALAKFWPFKGSVLWPLGKYNTLLKSLNSYCFLIIYVSMVSSCPSQGLRPYCSGNCTNK